MYLETLKQCSKCKKWKSLFEFYKEKRYGDGLASECKKCRGKTIRRYRKTEEGKKVRRKNNREYRRKYSKTKSGKKAIKKHDESEKRKTSYRRHSLKRKFNMTLEQYDKMFEEQGGVCAICGGIGDRGYRLAVDHNHETGKIRGLLCSKCNLHLFALENRTWRLLAEDYLHDHRS